MKPTTLFLEKEHFVMLNYLRERTGKSWAKIIREAIGQYYDNEMKQKEAKYAKSTAPK